MDGHQIVGVLSYYATYYSSILTFFLFSVICKVYMEIVIRFFSTRGTNPQFRRRGPLDCINLAVSLIRTLHTYDLYSNLSTPFLLSEIDIFLHIIRFNIFTTFHISSREKIIWKRVSALPILGCIYQRAVLHVNHFTISNILLSILEICAVIPLRCAGKFSVNTILPIPGLSISSSWSLLFVLSSFYLLLLDHAVSLHIFPILIPSAIQHIFFMFPSIIPYDGKVFSSYNLAFFDHILWFVRAIFYPISSDFILSLTWICWYFSFLISHPYFRRLWYIFVVYLLFIILFRQGVSRKSCFYYCFSVRLIISLSKISALSN